MYSSNDSIIEKSFKLGLYLNYNVYVILVLFPSRNIA